MWRERPGSRGAPRCSGSRCPARSRWSLPAAAAARALHTLFTRRRGGQRMRKCVRVARLGVGGGMEHGAGVGLGLAREHVVGRREVRGEGRGEG